MMSARPVGNPVIPHDPAWRMAFADEPARLQRAIDPGLLAVHHIGSTAVPHILAKPIIDMLAVVRSLDAVDLASGELVAIGYEAMGAYGIRGRR